MGRKQDYERRLRRAMRLKQANLWLFSAVSVEFNHADSHSNYSRSYVWMANQLGHVALGLGFALAYAWLAAVSPAALRFLYDEGLLSWIKPMLGAVDPASRGAAIDFYITRALILYSAQAVPVTIALLAISRVCRSWPTRLGFLSAATLGLIALRAWLGWNLFFGHEGVAWSAAMLSALFWGAKEFGGDVVKERRLGDDAAAVRQADDVAAGALAERFGRTVLPDDLQRALERRDVDLERAVRAQPPLARLARNVCGALAHFAVGWRFDPRRTAARLRLLRHAIALSFARRRRGGADAVDPADYAALRNDYDSDILADAISDFLFYICGAFLAFALLAPSGADAFASPPSRIVYDESVLALNYGARVYTWIAWVVAGAIAVFMAPTALRRGDAAVAILGVALGALILFGVEPRDGELVVLGFAAGPALGAANLDPQTLAQAFPAWRVPIGAGVMAIGLVALARWSRKEFGAYFFVALLLGFFALIIAPKVAELESANLVLRHVYRTLSAERALLGFSALVVFLFVFIAVGREWVRRKQALEEIGAPFSFRIANMHSSIGCRCGPAGERVAAPLALLHGFARGDAAPGGPRHLVIHGERNDLRQHIGKTCLGVGLACECVLDPERTPFFQLVARDRRWPRPGALFRWRSPDRPRARYIGFRKVSSSMLQAWAPDPIDRQFGMRHPRVEFEGRLVTPLHAAEVVVIDDIALEDLIEIDSDGAGGYRDLVRELVWKLSGKRVIWIIERQGRDPRAEDFRKALIEIAADPAATDHAEDGFPLQRLTAESIALAKIETPHPLAATLDAGA